MTPLLESNRFSLPLVRFPSRELCMRLLLAGALWGSASLPVSAGVVINEIFYHAPEHIEDLEYIELHNSSDQPVDLSGWAFTHGIQFRFDKGTTLGAKGFLVLCRNAERFKEYYDSPIAGTFQQHLKKKGELLELADASGKTIDSVHFKDDAPWPTSADGNSASLERICPESPGDDAANWSGSPLTFGRKKPGGTPGKPNTCYSSTLPPRLANLKITPQFPTPQQALQVSVDCTDAESASQIELCYRLAGPGFEKEEQTLPMRADGANRYVATLPGQDKDQLIRIRVKATSKKGAVRYFPAANDLRPALTAYVHEEIQPGTIPFAWIIDTTEKEFRSARDRATAPQGRGPFPFMPDPDQEARTDIQKQILAGIDLPSIWYTLTLETGADYAAVARYKPLFASKLTERNKLIDTLQESDDLQKRLQSVPGVVEKFKSGLFEEIRRQVSPEVASKLPFLNSAAATTTPKNGGGLFPNPEAVVQGWVRLEPAWFAATLNQELQEKDYTAIRERFERLNAQRKILVQRVAKLTRVEDGLRDIRDDGDSLSDHVLMDLKPLLSETQFKKIEESRENPTFAVRRAPPGGGGGPGRGGPGGFPGAFRPPSTEVASGRSAFIYFDPSQRSYQLFDYVDVVSRAGGQKVHFQKDQPLNRMTGINLIYENDIAVLVEPMAYELFRRAGVPTEQSYHVRLWLDGRPVGYQLLIEQPNHAFLHRSGLPEGGNFYKLLWYENGVVGQHEKKNLNHPGHDDIVALIDKLDKLVAEEQWAFIRDNFDVEAVASYFAASMALSNWDGFFNNYYVFHDAREGGKWTMIPWDEDQTWGMSWMQGPKEVFYNMPITFGMNGDTPPGGGGGGGGGFGFGFGGGTWWWRQPGWFSGPLLANPHFRKVFLARTKDLLEKVYTESVFEPIIQSLGERLRPEVRYRAEQLKESPSQAVENFDSALNSLRTHLKKRREFLLDQAELKNAKPVDRSEWAATAPAQTGKKKKKSAKGE